MENLGYKTTLRFYRIKFKKKLVQFNHEAELPDYFGPMIGDKKEVTIAELGTGPICTIGNLWKNVKVRLYASDILKNEFALLWKEYNATPVIPMEYQDIEHLTYADSFFDIVHCINTLDHTLNPKQAIKEMLRVCKPGGWIYLRHMPDQRKKYRGMHAWDINMVDGETVFSNPKEKFLLSEFGDFKTHIGEGFKRKDLIVSILHKVQFTKYHKFGAYHWKQYEDKNTKYSRHADRVKEWIKERNVLDIGAGDGKITHLLGIKGVDSEPEAVKLAREKGADVSLADAYRLPFKDEEFDAVFMGDVLEHLEFPQKALKEARRALKDYLYIASPEKGTNNDKFHYQEWTPEELKDLVEREGFALEGEILVVSKDKRIYGKFKKQMGKKTWT